ncbi:hypothetical protein [Nonomuraea salmonea]|uniref:hypothetical protein n=1 Tax=Nonomuraea salmonea TaxID=46181 RepID=UPI0031E9C6D6
MAESPSTTEAGSCSVSPPSRNVMNVDTSRTGTAMSSALPRAAKGLARAAGERARSRRSMVVT